jgi:hypothetical protein
MINQLKKIDEIEIIQKNASKIVQCDTCAISKMHRLIQRTLSAKAIKFFQILHFDLIICNKTFDDTTCIVKNDSQIDLIIYLTSTDDWEYWFKEEKKKFYRTQRAFMKDARYSFLDRINFRLLINLITMKEDQNSDIIFFLEMRSSNAFYNLVLIKDFWAQILMSLSFLIVCNYTFVL